MSKGSPIVTLRVNEHMLSLIDEAIELTNAKRSGEPWTRSSFIMYAVKSHLAKMKRSRAKRSKRAPVESELS